MTAFYCERGLIIKAYNRGVDWQLIDNLGNERWFSKWSTDQSESLVRAFKAMINTFDATKLNYVIYTRKIAE
jgi:hypothetical protein